MSKSIPLTIQAIIQETPDTKSFQFISPVPISYKAGQYLTFVFDQHGNEARRSFSLASSPVLNEPLMITVKRIRNGVFSRMLVDRARPGDIVMISGTGGVFTLPDDISSIDQLVFFAAGSGIVPIFSIIKTVLHTLPHIQVYLIYSNRSVEHTIFYRDLQDLQDLRDLRDLRDFESRVHKRLKIEFLFSNSPKLFTARLHVGLIEDFVNKYKLRDALFYICGPDAYMRLCTFTLVSLDVPLGNIKKEIFNTSKPVFKIEPPDKGLHKVEIIAGGKQFEIEVQYPDSILKTAKRHHIELPYSCEAGMCGNCMARCISGKVWMSNNEVLTEKELSQGLVLTCTGYPVGGPVELSFDNME